MENDAKAECSVLFLCMKVASSQLKPEGRQRKMRQQLQVQELLTPQDPNRHREGKLLLLACYSINKKVLLVVNINRHADATVLHITCHLIAECRIAI